MELEKYRFYLKSRMLSGIIGFLTIFLLVDILGFPGWLSAIISFLLSVTTNFYVIKHRISEVKI